MSPCYWKKPPNSRSEWLCLHLGNQWDWLYTKCCKVHEVNQPNQRSHAVARLSSATFGVVWSNSRSTGRHVCPSDCNAVPSPAPQLSCRGPSTYKMVVKNPSCKTCFQLQLNWNALHHRFNYKILPTLECFILSLRSSTQSFIYVLY